MREGEEGELMRTLRGRESPQALAAWTIYRDMGPERSTKRVAAALHKHPSRIEQWCTLHGWVARAHAHDEEISRRAAEKDQAARVAAADADRKERMAVSRAMYAKGWAALKDRPPEKIGAYAAVMLIDRGLHNFRLDAGDATERVEQSGDIMVRRIVGVPDDAV